MRTSAFKRRGSRSAGVDRAVAVHRNRGSRRRGTRHPCAGRPAARRPRAGHARVRRARHPQHRRCLRPRDRPAADAAVHDGPARGVQRGHAHQIVQQMATPTRLAVTPGNVFPGWNGGNPLRRGWSGRRGLRVPISYTNRYGALIRGDVFAPLPGAKDPYTGRELKAPYPGVVITTGSIQGSERMYWWLAQDLAERGYLVLTYDVQGQGTSETLPHEGSPVNALPFCNPFAEPQDIESFGCPGVPAQQASNFVYGTEDALDFFLSTPSARTPARRATTCRSTRSTRCGSSSTAGPTSGRSRPVARRA